MFNTSSSLENFMKEGDLCPRCKKGYLRDIGVDTVAGETKEQFRHTATMRVRKCDHCGHKQVDEVLEEHTRGPASNKVTGTVIRIDPEEKTEERINVLFHFISIPEKNQYDNVNYDYGYYWGQLYLDTL